LTRMSPALRIAGAESSKFRRAVPGEEAKIAERINRSGARLVLVGLGCPRQESFVHAMRPLLAMPLLAVGAAFDYHAGRLPPPPRGGGAPAPGGGGGAGPRAGAALGAPPAPRGRAPSSGCPRRSPACGRRPRPSLLTGRPIGRRSDRAHLTGRIALSPYRLVA